MIYRSLSIREAVWGRSAVVLSGSKWTACGAAGHSRMHGNPVLRGVAEVRC